MYLELLIKQIKGGIDKEESYGASNEYLNKYVEGCFNTFEKVLSALFDSTYKDEWRCLLYTNVFGYEYPSCKFDNPEQARKTAQEYYLSMYNDVINSYDNKKEYAEAINNIDISITDDKFYITIPTLRVLKTILEHGNDVITFNDRRFGIDFKVSKKFLKDLESLTCNTLTFYYHKDGKLSYTTKNYKIVTVKNEVL